MISWRIENTKRLIQGFLRILGVILLINGFGAVESSIAGSASADQAGRVARVQPFLKEGGLCLGGSPGVPHLLVRHRERQLRRAAQRYGHVSAFSPGRVKALAAQQGLALELLTGAYLIRKTGSFLENYRWWVRLNLVFGALVPNWPGEMFWAMRKHVGRVPAAAD